MYSHSKRALWMVTFILCIVSLVWCINSRRSEQAVPQGSVSVSINIHQLNKKWGKEGGYCCFSTIHPNTVTQHSDPSNRSTDEQNLMMDHRGTTEQQQNHNEPQVWCLSADAFCEWMLTCVTAGAFRFSYIMLNNSFAFQLKEQNKMLPLAVRLQFVTGELIISMPDTTVTSRGSITSLVRALYSADGTSIRSPLNDSVTPWRHSVTLNTATQITSVCRYDVAA